MDWRTQHWVSLRRHSRSCILCDFVQAVNSNFLFCRVPEVLCAESHFFHTPLLFRLKCGDVPFIFSRSYCHAVWSSIVVIVSCVCLKVLLSRWSLICVTLVRSAKSATAWLLVKRCARTKFGERAFSFADPAAWNNLPKDLQHCSNTDVFKKRLKTFLFQSAFVTDWFYFGFYVF